jgi:hypothetical protein
MDLKPNNMTCQTCFTDCIGRCPEGITVYAFLQANSAYLQYKWVITDKFNNAYQGYFVTGETGEFIIPPDDLPEGLLTEWSGEFKLQVFDEDDTPVRFYMVQEYDCVNFTVKGGTLVKDTIGMLPPSL